MYMNTRVNGEWGVLSATAVLTARPAAVAGKCLDSVRAAWVCLPCACLTLINPNPYLHYSLGSSSSSTSVWDCTAGML